MPLKHIQKQQQPTLKNPERVCVICGSPYKAVAPLQKTCTELCRKALWQQNSAKFKANHPDAMEGYNKRRLKKNPKVWREKARAERIEILTILGGKCIVCGADNPNWLHVDYAPTMVGTGYRHPRHKRWVLDHIDDFRILCANHHYELSITGKIEGTDITQGSKQFTAAA